MDNIEKSGFPQFPLIAVFFTLRSAHITLLSLWQRRTERTQRIRGYLDQFGRDIIYFVFIPALVRTCFPALFPYWWPLEEALKINVPALEGDHWRRAFLDTQTVFGADEEQLRQAENQWTYVVLPSLPPKAQLLDLFLIRPVSARWSRSNIWNSILDPFSHPKPARVSVVLHLHLSSRYISNHHNNKHYTSQRQLSRCGWYAGWPTGLRGSLWWSYDGGWQVVSRMSKMDCGWTRTRILGMSNWWFK